ncbi:MAG: phosphotransferase [Leucobacter sp.]
MASTPLTLAALATSAVPGLHVLGARIHSGDGEGDFAAVVVVAEEGEFIVRVPANAAAEARQSGELMGLAALAEGARSSLPFRVPETRGVTRAGDTRAVVSTFLSGGRVSVESLEADALLLQPVAETVAAIHALPASLVQQAGLPVRSAEEVREQASRLVARAAETRLLPETVHTHWETLLGTAALWDFAPTVVHGSFSAEQLLVEDESVTGVLGWSELSVGDPAIDLSWLLAAGPDVLDSVLTRYAVRRGLGGFRELRARAVFHHELEVARWLLHGVESHDSAIVEDGVAMLDRLVDRLNRSGGATPLRPALSDEEVRQLLDEMPEVPADPRSETAEFEALDEDREFFADTDFLDPVPESASASADPAESTPDAAEEGDSELADAHLTDVQLTEPIEPLESGDAADR